MAAVRALVDEINGHAAPHSEYLFRPELVVRSSTAIARAALKRAPCEACARPVGSLQRRCLIRHASSVPTERGQFALNADDSRRRLVARRRRLPGLRAQLRRLRRRRHRRPGRRPRPAAVPARPRRRRDLADAVLPLADGRRRLRRGRLPRRRPDVRHARRLRRDDRRRARAGPAGDRRRGAEPHLERAPPGSRRRWPPPPGSPERERYIFRDGRGPDGAEPPNDWESIFGGAGLDPGARRPVVPAPVRPRAARPELGAPRGARRVRRHPAVLARPRRGRVPRRRRPRHGQGAPGCPTSASAARPAATSGRAGCSSGAELPYFDQDGVHEIYRAWRPILDSYPGGRMAVAEAWASTPQRLARYVGPDELHQAFNFDFLRRDLVRRLVPQGDRHLAGRGRRWSARRPPGCCPTTTSRGTSPGTAAASSACAAPGPPRC